MPGPAHSAERGSRSCSPPHANDPAASTPKTSWLRQRRVIAGGRSIMQRSTPPGPCNARRMRRPTIHHQERPEGNGFFLTALDRSVEVVRHRHLCRRGVAATAPPLSLQEKSAKALNERASKVIDEGSRRG